MENTNNPPGTGEPPVLVQPEGPSVEALQSELAAEKAAHASTKDALDVLAESHADSTDALGQAAEIIEGQRQTIADLEDKITTLQTAPPEFPIIEVGKVKYAVEVKTFSYKGQHYTLEQLMADKALQAELVKKGVGFLVKQS